jgi:hypothetical protein
MIVKVLATWAERLARRKPLARPTTQYREQ